MRNACSFPAYTILYTACLLSPNKVAASLNDRYSLSLKSDMGCSLMIVWTLVSTSCILFCRTVLCMQGYCTDENRSVLLAFGHKMLCHTTRIPFGFHFTCCHIRYF